MIFKYGDLLVWCHDIQTSKILSSPKSDNNIYKWLLINSLKEALPRDFSGKNFVTLGFESEIHVPVHLQRVGNNCTNDPMTYVTFL